MLACEALCLSTQSVISLSVKTMLNNVGFKIFLLKPARLLREKSCCRVLVALLGFEVLFSGSDCAVGGSALEWLMFVARGSGGGCCWARA
jgi:hypothetical protein